MIRTLSVALAVATLVSSYSLAATVRYSLDLSVPGEFSLYAEELDGPADNGGIASYGITLAGYVTSIDHVSPYASVALDSESVSGPAGFSLFRSMGSFRSSQSDLFASQNTISPVHLNYGIGHAAGSFAGHDLTTQGEVDQGEWESRVLLASGTYLSDGGLKIDSNSPDTFSNVFKSRNSAFVRAATIEVPTEQSGVPGILSGSVNPGMTIDFGNGYGASNYSLETYNSGGESAVPLRIESATITGPDAELFSVSDFDPYWLDTTGEQFSVDVGFVGATEADSYTAFLQLLDPLGNSIAKYRLFADVGATDPEPETPIVVDPGPEPPPVPEQPVTVIEVPDTPVAIPDEQPQSGGNPVDPDAVAEVPMDVVLGLPSDDGRRYNPSFLDWIRELEGEGSPGLGPDGMSLVPVNLAIGGEIRSTNLFANPEFFGMGVNNGALSPGDANTGFGGEVPEPSTIAISLCAAVAIAGFRLPRRRG